LNCKLGLARGNALRTNFYRFCFWANPVATVIVANFPLLIESKMYLLSLVMKVVKTLNLHFNFDYSDISALDSSIFDFSSE